jgi:hypothetical protein
MGVRPEPGAVEAGTAALAARARERATRVRLVWRYAGRSVEATGPLLGGWGRRVPLALARAAAGRPRSGCGPLPRARRLARLHAHAPPLRCVCRASA